MDLQLVKVTEGDLEVIMNWRMKPDVTKYMYTDPKLSIESQKEWLNSITSNSSTKYWIVKYEGVKIGLLNLCDIDYKNQRCSWAYYIGDTQFRGKGIATSLECNVYDYVFYKLCLNKLCCEVFVFNNKVISIHEKFGSEIEGTLKQHICKNGEFYDIVVMGITRNKWDSIKSTFNYEKIMIEE